MVGRIAQSPGANLLCGAILVVTALWEIFEDLDRDFSLGAQHGVVTFGVIQILGALPECLEGVSRLHEGRERQSTDSDE